MKFLQIIFSLNLVIVGSSVGADTLKIQPLNLPPAVEGSETLELAEICGRVSHPLASPRNGMATSLVGLTHSLKGAELETFLKKQARDFQMGGLALSIKTQVEYTYYRRNQQSKIVPDRHLFQTLTDPTLLEKVRTLFRSIDMDKEVCLIGYFPKKIETLISINANTYVYIPIF